MSLFTDLKAKLEDFIKVNPELGKQVKDLAIGAGVAGVDATLVYVSTNVEKVDFGKLSPVVVKLTGLAVRELRGLLHGGKISDDVHVEALNVVVQEAPENK